MTGQDHPQPGDSKPCRAPGCPVVFHRPAGMRPNRWRKRQTCSWSCAVRVGNAARISSPPAVGPHRCALPGCVVEVPRVPGEPDSRYAVRRYCGNTHRRIASNRNRVRPAPAWKVERRCVCGATYVPHKKVQQFHDAACAARHRKASTTRETPTWKVERECVCGVRFTPRRKGQAHHDPACRAKPAPTGEAPPLIRVPREREVWRPASLGGPKTVIEYVLVESTG